ncbi:hypothetical protein ABPG72_010837 [Tetrahymena utriculariae]
MFSPQNNAVAANPLQKNQMLSQLLRQCNYSQVGSLNNTCFQVFSSYSELNPCIQTMKVGNTTQNVIELVGNVGIKLNNNTYHVLTHIVFPLQFPTCPPVIRIKNINPDKFCVYQKYLQNYTNDGFITLYLSETQTWNQHQNIIRLLQQMQKELSEVFPFYEKKQQFQNGMGQAQSNPNSPYNQFNYQNQQRPPSSFQQNPYANQGGYQQNQYNNPYGNYQQPPNNPLLNNNNNNFTGGNQPIYMGVGQQPQYEQQVAVRLKQELETTLKGILEEFNEEKKSSDQLYSIKQKLDENEASCNQLEEDIRIKSSLIQQQISILQEFISQNDSASINKDNVQNFIKEQNPLQSQILELISEQEAIKETIIYIEEAFKQKKIDFETLIKSIQYYSELEFNTKLLLIKCVANYKK